MNVHDATWLANGLHINETCPYSSGDGVTGAQAAAVAIGEALEGAFMAFRLLWRF